MKIVSYILAAAACVCLGQSAAALTINFDDLTPTVSYTFDGSNPIVTGPSVSQRYTIPIGSTGNFFADYNDGNVSAISVATINFGGTYNSFSVLWGSVDSYNTLDFLFEGNTVFTVNGSGAAAQFGLTADGSQTITYNTSGFNFDAVRLTTVSNAFEIDNITLVPEPGTWALLGTGIIFGGLALYRRRTANV